MQCKANKYYTFDIIYVQYAKDFSNNTMFYEMAKKESFQNTIHSIGMIGDREGILASPYSPRTNISSNMPMIY